MAELQLIGIGTWSPRHGDWEQFRSGVSSGDWPDDVKLQPERIPARERRRAPQLVKMAIEVMDQACNMAELEPDDVAVIFSSAMGDMQITDYMCSILAQDPRLVSPIKFHNSVHNAAPGYWSITTGAFCPASAVSAFEYTSSMAFLEACIQAVEEDTPVLCVTQEVAAPAALMEVCPAEAAFSAAFLLAPAGFHDQPLASVRFSVDRRTGSWPPIDDAFAEFATNMSARFLPVLCALAQHEDIDMTLPLAGNMSLRVELERCTT